MMIVIFSGRLRGKCSPSRSADFAEFPTLRHIFAGENLLEVFSNMSRIRHGPRRLPARCCRCHFILWNCWWGSCRRWCYVIDIGIHSPGLPAR